MNNQAEPGPGVTVIGERPSIDAPELPAKPYEFVMETEVESLEKMHKVGRHRKFEIHVDELGIRIERVSAPPRLVRVGGRLVARPTAPVDARPAVDVSALIEEERNRWP